jgi:hypothetical protein
LSPLIGAEHRMQQQAACRVAGQRRREVFNQGESSSASSPICTLRAGTTVEMACL